jgi:hypothetical protein
MLTTLLDTLRQAGCEIDPSRLQRARDEVVGHVCITSRSARGAYGVAKYRYACAIHVHPQLECDCECPDWQDRGQYRRRPCKHILGLALEVGELPDSDEAAIAAEELPEPPSLPLDDAPATSFGRIVGQAIERAVLALADTVHGILAAGETPLLIGPTGCGKTSAVRTVPDRLGWGFDEVSGSSSFVDADLVGIRVNGTESAGVFGRVFSRARAGHTVLLFLDEFTRFNTRAQDLLMRPLLPTPAETAQRMGIDASVPVRLIEAPLWGVEWAPFQRTPIVLACNPWGSPIDPALARRVTPVVVEFAAEVAELFRSPLREGIIASWKATAEAQVPLPVEYSALARAESPDDRRLFVAYLNRMRAVDRAAAEGFRRVLEGIGLRV